MFLFLAVELSALFLGVSLLVGMLQRHIPPARIEAMLSSSRRRSYLLAAGLGAITPFCSCSTIPMLKGLIRARAGFGPLMVFLFASPLLNPVVVVLLAVTFGAGLTVIYVLAALLVSLAAGWLLQALGFERHVRGQSEEGASGCGSSASGCGTAQKASVPETTAYAHEGPAVAFAYANAQIGSARPAPSGGGAPVQTATATSRYSGLWQASWSEYRGVLPYLLLGIAIGSVIYGFMPTGMLERYAGPGNPFAVPIASVIGAPLYIRAEAVIPLAGALMAKGVSAGTVLALIIGSAGASLTELILLRSLFTYRLLAAFVAVVITMAVVAGYVTQWLF